MLFHKPFYKKYALRAWLKIYYCLSRSKAGSLKFTGLNYRPSFYQYNFCLKKEKWTRLHLVYSQQYLDKKSFYTLSHEYRKKNQIRSIIKFALDLI